jgi:hypothetical protein
MQVSCGSAAASQEAKLMQSHGVSGAGRVLSAYSISKSFHKRSETSRNMPTANGEKKTEKKSGKSIVPLWIDAF